MSRYYVSRCIAPGRRHLDLELPGQDHAATRRAGDCAVLCVADGVSLYRGWHSSAHVGAYLAAEMAAHGAAAAVSREPSRPEAAREGAVRALHHGLRDAWAEMGDDAAYRSILSTLLLAVAGPGWAAVWASGDGRWGATARHDATVRLPAPFGAAFDGLEHVADVQPVAPGFVRAYGRIDAPAGLRRLAVVEARRSPATASELLPCVMHVEGTAVGLWVATDGLRHEEQLLAPLSLPVRTRKALQTHRPDGCDDLAVAWAAEPLPGLFGVGECPHAEDPEDER